MKGQIIKGIGGFYYIDTGSEVIRAKGRGLFRKTGESLVVGDYVEVRPEEAGDGVIEKVYERKNSFIRPPVSNVDRLIIVSAPKNPDINFDIVDKFLIMAEKSNAAPIICINKKDLCYDGFEEKIRRIYGRVYPVVFVSGKTGEGMEDLIKEISGCSAAFAGPSGAGKSTIINRLIPDALMETGNVSKGTGRGRHTTRHVEIFKSEDTMIFDTPGFTSFNLLQVEENELQGFYPEIDSVSSGCKFRDCRHINEPGCAVRKALEDGEIPQERYDSYISNLETIRKNRKY